MSIFREIRDLSTYCEKIEGDGATVAEMRNEEHDYRGGMILRYLKMEYDRASKGIYSMATKDESLWRTLGTREDWKCAIVARNSPGLFLLRTGQSCQGQYI